MARFTADQCEIILEGINILLAPSTMMAKRGEDYYRKALTIRSMCEHRIKQDKG